jgi:phenylacetate-CoA ligase
LKSGRLSPEATRALDRPAIEAIQAEKLRAMMAEIGGKNAFYREKLKRARIEPNEVRSPADLRRLPFTTKSELAADQAAHPPYGRFHTYEPLRYCRLHQTSGTSGGRPLRWLDTPESWEWMLRLWEIIYHAAGLRPVDRFFFPFSFGPFLGFWAAFEGAARLGRLALAGGAMNGAARLKFMIDNEATVVACTPTYALHLIEAAEREGIDLAASAVRALIVAGEPGGSIPETRARIESGWGARVLDHTGMTEIGPLGFESIDSPGGVYLIESEAIVESIDPETGEPSGPGERGELIVTTLGRWGSPLLRYRTGDLVVLERPESGDWPFARMRGGILGRADDMVIVRGNNLYPSALEAILRRFPEILEYQAEVFARDGLNQLRLTVESSAPMGSNSNSLLERIASAVKEAFNFRPEVVLAGEGALPRFELKASRFRIHAECRQGGG